MMKIAIAGDFCPIGRVASHLQQGNFGYVLGEARKVIDDCDFSIVNLEAPIVTDTTAQSDKSGPALKTGEFAVKALKFAGFHMATLANNHIRDYGDAGVKETLKVCSEYGLLTVGADIDIESASAISYQKIKDKTIAIINCCEQEFSIATNECCGANPINPIEQFYQIQLAKKNADCVLVIVHGGIEHYQLPTPRMKKTYRFFIDAGADAVINHHQHCPSGYEIYNNKPIVYGLGNFCFDRTKKKEIWNQGYLAIFEIDGEAINLSIKSYLQCKEEPVVKFLSTEGQKLFYADLEGLNRIIADDVLLKQCFEKHCMSESHTYLLPFEPYQYRLGRGLYVRKMLPSMISKNKFLYNFDMIRCESHLERLICVLEKTQLNNRK